MSLGSRPVALGTGVLLVAVLVAVGCGSSLGAGRPAARTTGGPLSIWPNPVRAGQPAMVEIADRRAISAATLIECVAPPGGRSRCRTAVRRTQPGGRTAVRLALGRVGLWRVEVRAAGPLPLAPGALDLKQTIRVVGGHVRLLATGDSEIQGIDDMLASDLPGVRVTGEAHISTGISKPFMFDWVARAAAQAKAIHPDVTAVYIGANDGFPLPARSGRTVDCCAADWVALFARRTESMMGAYLRGGAGRVYWFTLPAPRDQTAAPMFRAVNRAFAIAAASFPFGVHLIDLGPVFTPGGRYRASMEYQGRSVTVREPDGYHLSLAGDQIATGLAIGAMRADGLLTK